MNIVEKLLKLDAGSITVPTQEVKIERLSTLVGEDANFTCNAISLDAYNEVQSNSVILDKKGNIKGYNTGGMQLSLVLAGVPELKSKELMDHFSSPTPEELIKKILLPGDVSNLAKVVSQLSGIEEIETAGEDVKN
ncbi:phage tail assembly chaperone [Clostridium estertheticum]|uniref:phage tail assembly chaperone n=1 Tax=Clostridium estertheticum TaxID=238834 RepID=UPI00124DAA33|nr:XkdN-like protein [Clostridium estertheticum]MBZ9615294.1 XkdN-like protein [Clostridium estertheticum subsp. laramiense]WAG75183.1 XkdN-like protein [Clostridium estertheticum]